MGIIIPQEYSLTDPFIIRWCSRGNMDYVHLDKSLEWVIFLDCHLTTLSHIARRQELCTSLPNPSLEAQLIQWPWDLVPYSKDTRPCASSQTLIKELCWYQHIWTLSHIIKRKEFRQLISSLPSLPKGTFLLLILLHQHRRLSYRSVHCTNFNRKITIPLQLKSLARNYSK